MTAIRFSGQMVESNKTRFKDITYLVKCVMRSASRAHVQCAYTLDAWSFKRDVVRCESRSNAFGSSWAFGFMFASTQVRSHVGVWLKFAAPVCNHVGVWLKFAAQVRNHFGVRLKFAA